MTLNKIEITGYSEDQKEAIKKLNYDELDKYFIAVLENVSIFTF